MSGGSWNYVYEKFEETGDRLVWEGSAERRALGAIVKKIATAMRAIEWVDSCDSAPGDELASIMEVVTPEQVLSAAGKKLRSEIAAASAVLAMYAPEKT